MARSLSSTVKGTVPASTRDMVPTKASPVAALSLVSAFIRDAMPLTSRELALMLSTIVRFVDPLRAMSRITAAESIVLVVPVITSGSVVHHTWR